MSKVAVRLRQLCSQHPFRLPPPVPAIARRSRIATSPLPLMPALLASALLLSACGDREAAPPEDDSAPPPVDPAQVLDQDSPPLPDQGPAEPIGQALEELTGTWTKAVWMQHDNPDSADTYATGTRHYLWGIDSRDGRGVRQLLEGRGNYSRPMVTPDGALIVYTNKQVDRDNDGRKHYDVTVMVTDWHGAEPLALAAGYATDLWRDPETGVVWVIAARDLLPSERASMFAPTLVRFRLDDPEVEEVLWDQTEISLDNIQLSRDGRRGSGLFPWPEVGFFDFANNDWQRLAHGCWPSHSPDNSYITWVFDGAHRNLTMYQRGEHNAWRVPVNQAPGVDGAEVYHPRWSNHPRYLAITGPYADGEEGQNPITVGGTHAEVYIGRFSEDLTEVEAWVCLTDNDVGDFYPDVWIHNGHKEVLANFPQGPRDDEDPASATDGWPAADSGLLFGWTHRNHRNQFSDADGNTRPFQLNARGHARFGRHHQALLDAGHFEPDGTSAEAIAAALQGGAILTIESLLSPDPHQPADAGTLWQLGPLTLEVAVNEDTPQLQFRQHDQAAIIDASFPHQTEALHLAARLQPGQAVRVWIDGTEVELNAALDFDPAAGASDGDQPTQPLRVGGGHWPGGLERLAVYRSELEPAAIAELANASRAAAADRPPLPVLKVRATLVQTTPVPAEEEIDPYTSALVEYIYDVDEVIEGDYAHDQILVRHWGLLDRHPAPGFPRETGSSHELRLQPWDQHPQLEGERRTEDTGNYVLPVFYDIAPAREP